METQFLKNYFPNLTKTQIQQFELLMDIFPEINAKVNLVSRKDIQNLEVNHILHSCAIQLVTPIPINKKIIDIGTGGGFPGVPLAILNPQSKFVLVDSISKKITAVNEIIAKLKLTNAIATNERVENIKDTFDIAVARAVAPSSLLYGWMAKHWTKNPHFILLKGGDLSQEFRELNQKFSKHRITETQIYEYLKFEFFNTKKVVVIRK